MLGNQENRFNFFLNFIINNIVIVKKLLLLASILDGCHTVHQVYIVTGSYVF